MNKNIKTLYMFLGFALLMCVAAFAYNSLSKDILPEDTLAVVESEDKSENESENESKEASDEDKILAPDFTVLDMDGNEVKLSDMLGTPVVLNFWASWCPPCKGEMPDFEKVYKEVGNDIAFMMVNLTDGARETKKHAQDYVEEQGFTFPVYLDTEQSAAYAYGISAIPTTLFIDKDGYVAAGVQSAINESTLRRGIELIQ